MKHVTLLDRVRAQIAEHKGAELDALAERSEMSYDTLLRIRDGRTDPAFGKVQRLAELLRVVEA